LTKGCLKLRNHESRKQKLHTQSRNSEITKAEIKKGKAEMLKTEKLTSFWFATSLISEFQRF
jgi:hypothetical protein